MCIRDSPIAEETKKVCDEFGINPTVAALNGGEDYELLFTGKIGLDKNKNITKIGQMKKGRNINITDFDDITCFDGYKHKF